MAVLCGCQEDNYDDAQENKDVLVIYALEDNYQMWELNDLINKYQEQYDDAQVVLQIGMENSSDDRAAKIQRLNNSIISGKGPDILLLEGLPQEKYVEQGMLEDMEEFVHKQVVEQDLFPTIVETYKVDEAQYGIPYCFTMMNVSALEHYEGFESLDTLEGFRDYLKQLQEKDDIPVYGKWSYDQIISIVYRLYVAEQEGFLEKISEENIEKFYQVIHEIYQMVDMKEVEEAGKTMDTVSLLPLGYETLDLVATGNIQFSLDYIETPDNLRNLIALQQNGYATSLLKNENNLLCVPAITFGVVKKDKEKQELIESFLSFALSENVQQEIDTLPVNRNAMKKVLNNFNNEQITIETEEPVSVMTLDFTKLAEDEIEKWIDIFEKTTCVGMTDQKIFGIIMENARYVVAGKMSEADAAHEAYRQISVYQDE